MVLTIHGEMDEAQLRKTEGTHDDDCETTTWVEYCLLACDHAVHQQTPVGAGVHCPHHVHRSVGMILKQGAMLNGALGQLG